MAEVYGSPQQIRSDTDAKKGGVTEAALWLKKIKAAEKGEKKWRDSARKAVRIYEGEEKSQISNLYHSNIETLVPSLYNSTPIPDVRRRYNDEDKIGKEVCDLVERAVSYTIDQFAFDQMMVAVVKASVLPGRGVVRVRYEPRVEGQQIVDQKTYVEVVPWDRFVRGPSRSWARMPWCAYRHDLSQDELAKLGVKPDKLEQLGFGSSPYLDDEDEEDEDEENDVSGAQKGVYLTLPVYEIWDKAKRRVLFVTPTDQDFILAEVPDVLKLPDFFDCPEPLQQIRREGSLVPVNPYEIYAQLMEEFNALSVRISALIKECKVRGIADIKLKGDVEAVQDLIDGELKYAEGAQEFLSGGQRTLADAIAWWPIEQVKNVLESLYLQREQLKQLIYEVTGLSDILRGASDARETATAQQIKTQWGSLRLQRLQAEVARVARDIFRIMSQIICTHYEWERIKQMTGLTFAPEQPDMGEPPEGMPPEQAQQMMMQAQQQAQQQAMQFEQEVMQLFKNDGLRNFRIDIESDSTIRGDQQRNAEQMNFFLQATSQFATAIGGLVQLAPQVLPAATEIFVSFARKFKLGKQAEDALESLTEVAKQASESPQEDPEAMKAQADMQAAQMKMQADQAKAQADIQLKQMDMQLKEMDLKLKAIELQMKQIEGQNAGAELQVKQQGMDLEYGHKARMAELEYAAQSRMKGLDLEHAAKQVAVKDEAAKIDLTSKRRAAEEDVRLKRMTADVDIDGKLRKGEADRKAQEAKASDEKAKAGPKKIKIERDEGGAIVGGTVG